MSSRPIIDGHVHFWDPGARHHDWLAGHPSLQRRFGPEDLRTGHHDVVGFVFVQADCRDGEALDEVAWVESLAEQDPRIQGIVAHAALERGSAVRAHLRALGASPRVVGVRRLLQDEPEALMEQASFVDGVRLLGEFDFTFDVCVRHDQLRAVVALVTTCPGVTFVLDHLGKPAIAAGQLDPWRSDLRELARRPNVLCKLSGLASEAKPGSWRPTDLNPYLEHAIETFGPRRCLLGSDWPLATLATPYASWFDLVLDALGDLGEGELAAVLAGNAVAAYGLGTLDDHEHDSEAGDACSELRR